ncbi:hypothetical protein NIIDMKKI_10270 [Mycobacterium kansasii]|uniref:Uncharacterized protein n=1 Tax=Mycobacterium kansasii TaxID=1768 RepID=A0A7G1I492_MYCKA|nr:hypothetical protein NIIDMKKI_10270 [Mycobacterium kansasii]
MSVDALDRPVKAVVFRPLSLARRIKNSLATVVFFSSFAIALVPLVWLLWVVIERGWYAIIRVDWWTHSLRGVLPEEFAGACTTRSTGHWYRPGWRPRWPCRWA